MAVAETVHWSIGDARAYYTEYSEVTKREIIASKQSAPEALVTAIDRHDLGTLQQLVAADRRLLHGKIQLGKLYSSRLKAYWRYGHVAYFEHWCTPLHWAVQVLDGDGTSVPADSDLEPAHDIIKWLLAAGAYPTAKDGWDHDVFDLACTDPSNSSGVDLNMADSSIPRFLIDTIQQLTPDRQLAHHLEPFDLGRTRAPHEMARAHQMFGKYCTVHVALPRDPEIDISQVGVLIDKMQQLDASAGAQALHDLVLSVDDHDGTPIGLGFTVGIVQAQLSTDAELRSLLPAELQTGLFDGRFDDTPASAIVRFSHTEAVGSDLARMAVKIELGADEAINLTLTESIRSFAIGNKKQLDAFIYGEEHGLAWMAIKHPMATKELASNASASSKEAKKGIGCPSFNARVMGKSYYSMTPFAVGPASAKFAFKSDLRTRANDSATKEGLQQELIEDAMAAEVVFDLMLQVATDPKKHPIDDSSVVWDEATAPYIKLGELRIPRQDIHGPGTPNAGMSVQFDGALENTKQLSFGIGESELHKPLGYVNQFRAVAYPHYDAARQQHLLGEDKGSASRCPFLRANAAFQAFGFG